MTVRGRVGYGFSGIRSFRSYGVDLHGFLNGCGSMVGTASGMSVSLLRMRHRARKPPMGDEYNGKQQETEPLAHSERC